MRVCIGDSSLINLRAKESTLKENNKVYPKNCVICTIMPEDEEKASIINNFTEKSTHEARIKVYENNFLCKYKIGDGIHKWTELEYQPGVIPLIMIGPDFSLSNKQQSKDPKIDVYDNELQKELLKEE